MNLKLVVFYLDWHCLCFYSCQLHVTPDSDANQQRLSHQMMGAFSIGEVWILDSDVDFSSPELGSKSGEHMMDW